MTLLEAFRRLTPDCAADDFVAQDAISRVQDELASLARRLTFSDGIREDAAAETLIAMLYGGARSASALECDSDKRVRGFLETALRRKAIDLWRADPTREEVTIDDPDRPQPLASPGPSPDAILVDPDRTHEALSIDQLFVERLVPGCAATFKQAQPRQDFLASVRQMRALAFEATTMEAVVIEATGRSDDKAEATVHKRHQRARFRLVEHIADELAAGRLTPEQARQFRGCVSFLHRRASSAKEAARAAQREQR